MAFLETMKNLFNREKPQTGPDRLDLLRTGLPDSKKHSLAGFIRDRQQASSDKAVVDVGAYSASLFADEIAAGTVSVSELYVLADIFAEYRNNPKKGEPDHVHSLAFKISTELCRQTKAELDFKKASGEKISPDEEEKNFASIKEKSPQLAEKIISAPRKLTSDMAGFADQLEVDVVARRESFLAKPHGDLTINDLEAIIQEHPDEYEKKVTDYELIATQVGLIEGPGMTECVAALRDFKSKTSPVDGTLFKTVADRISYAETLANPGEVKAKWYELKPPGYSRTFAREFVSNEVIPQAIANHTLFEDVAKEIHWYQISGSNEQKSIVEKIGRNWAGKYRKEKVFIGGDTIHCSCPEQEQVPDLMAKLGKQVELFSAEIEKRRQTTSPEEFEKLVVQYACLVLHRFTSIHPMADGNGRTSRSLYEYVVAKHLGQVKMAEYSAKHFGPQETLPATAKYQQVDMSQRAQMNFHPGDALYDQVVAQDPNFLKRNGFEHANLVAHLENTDFDFEVVNNQDLTAFADSIITAIKANKK